MRFPHRTGPIAIVLPLLLSMSLLLMLATSARCDDTTIVTSPHDTRQYAAFALPNRLKVLVISDPETDKAACALDVFVGSNANPDNRPGLAHFLEHMLFLGTREYPEPDAFQAFIAKHAGEQNAYTGFAHTNYYFDVDTEHLRAALERFGQFFIAPLFSKIYVDRERSAVDAEFHTKKKNDAWRGLAAMKQAMNPRHPLSRFTIGNLATLSEDADGEGALRAALIAFYRRYYSANLMAVVVLGKEPIDVLRRWAREVFSAIPDFDARPPPITEPLFLPAQLPSRIVWQPVQEQRALELSFPAPALKPHYKTSPLHYIAHIIGHEGEGSLLSLLKARGWAEALSAGVGFDYPDGATFDVSITLTEKGIRNTDAITAFVFQAIRRIGREGIREWLYHELSRLADMDFLFQENLPPMDYAKYLANALHEYPLSDVLRGPFALDRYDAALIRRYLLALTPDNALVMVSDPDLQETTDAPLSQAPWFGTRYRWESIAPDVLRAWREAPITPRITIPAPNPFIPEDLALEPVPKPGRPLGITRSTYAPKDKPARILHAPGLAAWFQQDTTYRMPRADFYFSIRSPVANDTPRHAVMTALFTALARDRLAEFSYPAAMAGLDYALYPHMRGLSTRISGYHDKQGLLLARIVETLRQPEFTPERFRLAKQKLTRKLRNTREEPPYRQAFRELRGLLLRPHWAPETRVEALAPVTLPDLHAFIPELFGRLSLVALSHGNLRREKAPDAMVPLQKLIRDALPTRVPHGTITKLTKGVPRLRSITLEHNDSVALVYFQGSRRGFRELAAMELLEQILKAPFFHQLRTERELGYIVFAGAYPFLQVPGLLFLVQSPDTHPADLTGHIRQFLASGSDLLDNMREAEFARHKSALITRILAREETMKVRSERYWEEIDQGIEGFDSRERKADAVRAITRAEIREIYRTRIRGEDKRQLILHAVGNREEYQARDEKNAVDAGSVIIRDVARFKREQPAFPQKDDS
uniref:Protease 3 n=1 Tax=Candidatus Kentrum sp. LPFa TaxID=2126335 RepID=A0A450W219_9GAMM|nr:MAG: Secreted Zn-dependent peptidases, insulinase-like [Candidatus Kentron sp. LPFa]VFK27379.1 MAG: Secreted Zn-dependent peptidases, insulinase-like [Candidatus Kentron sp. LPFa]